MSGADIVWRRTLVQVEVAALWMKLRFWKVNHVLVLPSFSTW